MSIATRCSHCGAAYNLNDRMLGKRVRCKSCQRPFLVEEETAGPRRARSSAVSARPRRPAPVEDDDDDLADDELPRGRRGAARPARKSSTGKILLLVGGIGTAVVLGCCGVPSLLFWHYGTLNGGPRAGTPVGPVVVHGDMTPEQQRDFQKQAEAALDKALGPGKAPPGFAVVAPPGNVDEALQFLNQDGAHKQAAVHWLANQPVDPAKQAQVARALDPLVSQKGGALQSGAALALQTWADRDSVPVLAKVLDGCELKRGIPPEFMKTILATVGRLKDPRGADAVARFLTNFFQQHDAEQALAALGPAAEPAVLKYYFHHDGGARDAARRLAQGYGTKEDAILAQAVVSLKDPDRETRFQTAE
ncbi:MAG TPA: hypothetical protein VJ739_11655, partial [Gemmataceae bacterium]|nr:hypothetical protein [Gemmataceae bacterium]